MSKKTETKTTASTQAQTQAQFNPASMATFNAFMPQYQQGMQDYAKNPLESTFFNQRLGMSLQNVNQMGQRNMGNIMNNARMSGYGNQPGFMQAMMGQSARATSGQSSNAFLQNLFQGEQARQWALSNMGSYQPLQIGQNSNSNSSQNTVQKESGLGTWLPQVIGAGVGMAAGAMTGGASFGLTGAMKGMGGGALAGLGRSVGGFGGGGFGGYGGQMPSPWFGPSFGGYQPYGNSMPKAPSSSSQVYI